MSNETYREQLEEVGTIEVTGRGRFPFDMLRHDLCWPATPNDAELLADLNMRTVRLCIHKRRMLTKDRWSSFGWVAVWDARDPFFLLQS